MSDEKTFIDVQVHEEAIEDIIALVRDNSDAARIGALRWTMNAGAASGFPTIDPSIIDAFKDATIILSTGSAAATFILKLRELISNSEGKVKAVDRKTKKQF